MEYYRDILGGELALTTYGEGGMADDPGVADRIMHGQLETASGFTLMGGDAAPGTPAQPMSGVQISLSGDTASDAELSGYYDKLAEKGTVVEPLVTAPWGDKFGMVTDPYGVLWMVNIAGAQQPA
jgi:PhnB protein